MKKLCMIKGCNTRSFCKAMCRPHYERFKRKGVVGGAIKSYTTVLSVAKL